MTDLILSRPGQNLATSDGSYAQNNVLFLKTMMGEVLTAFDGINVFKPLHLTRSIAKGKSAGFPATWKASARYHVPGTPVLGSNKIKHTERTINIDDLLLADVTIYSLDEAKADYEFRQIYSHQLGEALAKTYDTHVAQVIVNAARASATIPGEGPGGSVLSKANAKTDGEVLASMIFGAAQVLDEKDIPENERYAVVRPAQYYLMAQTTKLLDRDWGGSGVYADGTILKVAGVSIVKSNNLPNAVVSTVEGDRNDYSGDFTKTAAVVFQKGAAGTVTLMDLAMQMSGEDFRIMYQGDLIVAKYALGHGILRPECAVELATV